MALRIPGNIDINQFMATLAGGFSNLTTVDLASGKTLVLFDEASRTLSFSGPQAAAVEAAATQQLAPPPPPPPPPPTKTPLLDIVGVYREDLPTDLAGFKDRVPPALTRTVNCNTAQQLQDALKVPGTHAIVVAKIGSVAIAANCFDCKITVTATGEIGNLSLSTFNTPVLRSQRVVVESLGGKIGGVLAQKPGAGCSDIGVFDSVMSNNPGALIELVSVQRLAIVRSVARPLSVGTAPNRIGSCLLLTDCDSVAISDVNGAGACHYDSALGHPVTDTDLNDWVFRQCGNMSNVILTRVWGRAWNRATFRQGSGGPGKTIRGVYAVDCTFINTLTPFACCDMDTPYDIDGVSFLRPTFVVDDQIERGRGVLVGPHPSDATTSKSMKWHVTDGRYCASRPGMLDSNSLAALESQAASKGWDCKMRLGSPQYFTPATGETIEAFVARVAPVPVIRRLDGTVVGKNPWDA